MDKKPAQPRKGGRPAFKPTAALRNRVATGAAGGMQHEEIAIALGISMPTLRKYFEAELSVVANRKRLEVLEAMFRVARKGNVAAQKAIMATSPHLAAPPVPAADPVPAGALGKKEQANEDAKTAQQGTEWADLLPARANVVAIR